MNGLERYSIIDSIARELQRRMTTRQINVFLGGYGVKHDTGDIVPSKRIYVEGLLADETDKIVIKIANDLGLEIPTGATTSSLELNDLLTGHGLVECRTDFDRALQAISTDPDGAIGSASSTLESILKAILDAFDESYPSDESLSHLVKAVFGLMNLSPESHADPEIKRVLGGLLNAAVGLGVLRTKHSSFHGKGRRQRGLTKRHARLAVNSLSAIGLFLIETYLERFAGQTGPLKDDEV